MPRLTLAGIFFASAVVLATLLGGLYMMLSTQSAAAAAEGARRPRETASLRVQSELSRYLSQSEETVTTLEFALTSGRCGMKSPADVQPCLLTALLTNPNLAEVTFTHGEAVDWQGDLDFEAQGRWQLSAFRERPNADSEPCIREVSVTPDGSFGARTWCQETEQLLQGSTHDAGITTAEDPLLSFGFSTPMRHRERILTSDLSYSQLDEALPEREQRVVVKALKAVSSSDGKPLGVLKVGLLAGQLNALVAQIKVNPDPEDPFTVFVCDPQGRLITGLAPGDLPVSDQDDLRVDASHAPPAVKAALAHDALKEVSDEHPSASGTFTLEGRRYLVDFKALRGTQDWRAGVVGPEDYYLGTLASMRTRMLSGVLGLLAVILIGGVLSLRAFGRALSSIRLETRRMSQFDFEASAPRSPFADVKETLEGLERAKTAVRAMGKYVPLGLVRQLFADNKEPVPGGSLHEVSILFSDLEGFTTLVEQEPPDQLAKWLGLYFEAMTQAVDEQGGVVDKFIGDAVMALWNVPQPLQDHAVRACRGAWRCLELTEALFASPAWGGRPPLVTRIGVHVDRVLVGHIGAKSRLSYTAIGDGVNLASRLEGLNKQYGTRLLVSGAVEERARTVFAFRRLDRVAVKGRASAVEVFELLGPAESPRVAAEVVGRYERALAAYFARDFAGACALLTDLDDAPSQALALRCAHLVSEPPPPDWDGTWTASSK